VRKRKLVDEVRGDWNVSIRRACRAPLFDTSSYHYKSRRPGQTVLEQRIKEICQTRVRYGGQAARAFGAGGAAPNREPERLHASLGRQTRSNSAAAKRLVIVLDFTESISQFRPVYLR
jgi:putative transposase